MPHSSTKAPVRSELLTVFATRAAAPCPFDKLTERQYAVATMMLEGVQFKEIAARLDLSPKTVDAHRSNLYRILGVDGPVALALLAVATGLIEVPVVTNTPEPALVKRTETPTITVPPPVPFSHAEPIPESVEEPVFSDTVEDTALELVTEDEDPSTYALNEDEWEQYAVSVFGAL